MSTFTCLLLCWHTARANRRHTIFNCKTTVQMLYRVSNNENCNISYFVYVHKSRGVNNPKWRASYDKDAIQSFDKAYLKFPFKLSFHFVKLFEM